MCKTSADPRNSAVFDIFRIILEIRQDPRRSNRARYRAMLEITFSYLHVCILKTLKMGVISACMVLMMKWGPRNITDRPGVSIM